ncbi:FecR domain-containing protein [Sphingobacterium bambusae]|uniref:FecR domain-containing protein n=1 Tax=Sphingobacterium bambusae TaxID=662858 RepID=A0ABW6BEG0_9SPHI|nr:FecR domain-containing protein [Sphingobacterium bambusae]WPL48627.1 FecR domain-containing protein [Sphingobacterium bambusae]
MKEENRLAKFLDGSLSDAEKNNWEQDPDKELYEQIKRYSADLSVPSNTADEHLLEAIMNSKAKTVKKMSPFRSSRWLAVAAVLLCVFLGGWLMWSSEAVFQAPAHAALQVELPDGSEVLLDKGSKASYKRFTWLLQRDVKLEGDAYFAVERGQTFTVETTMGTVRVLGTRFDVLTKDGNLSVHCYHGKVEVQQAQEKMLLTAGQSLRLDDGTWERDSLFLQEPAWKADQLLFQSASLDQVVREMERSFAVTFKSSTQQVAGAQQFTGKLPTSDLEAAIHIIEKAFSISCRKLADNRYVIEAK